MLSIMNVFVAGASGAIGRRLLPQLIEAGHAVTGMTRSPEKAAAIDAAGATAVVCDAFDPAGLARVLGEAAPAVVVNQLTDLPQAIRPRRLKQAYAANNRVRVEGVRNLQAAARAAGARRLVSQSVAFFYTPSGRPGRRGEDQPLWTDGPGIMGEAVRALAEMEGQTLAGELEGVVLRYGFLYGPGTWYAPGGDVAEQVRRRRYPIAGKGDGVYCFVHVDDAADAAVRALDGPPGTYNVVDDDPAPVRDWLPAYATALGAPKPLRVPGVVATLAAGKAPVSWMDSLEGVDNARAKADLGWTPRHPSWRTGFSASA